MFVHLCVHSICLFFSWHMYFQEEQELLWPSTLDEDFLEPLSLVSFVSFPFFFVLSESSEEEKNIGGFLNIYVCVYIYIHTYTYTYIHVYTYIHTHMYIYIYISGAFAQLTIKIYTSNRLREEDDKLNVWLLPQWMHSASVLRLQGEWRRLRAWGMLPSFLLAAHVCSNLKVRNFNWICWT